MTRSSTKRTVALFGGAGLLFGAVAGVGWHFQPSWAWAAPVPRSLGQLVPAGLIETRGVVGSVALGELRQWSELWLPAATVGPVAGGLLGLATGALLAATGRQLVGRDTARGPGRTGVPAVVPLGGLGLLSGVLAAVGWHLNPYGGLWSGGTFLPTDIGYPILGLTLGVALAGLLRASGRRLVRLP